MPRVAPPRAAGRQGTGRHVRTQPGESPAQAAVTPGEDALGELDFELSDEQLFEILRADLVDQLSPWARRLSDRRFKWGLAIGGAVSLIVALVVVAGVVGSFVHP